MPPMGSGVSGHAPRQPVQEAPGFFPARHVRAGLGWGPGAITPWALGLHYRDIRDYFSSGL
jgi:hypothetical protein